ncbi:MAG TPA: class I poly(R)-hydroxyalkanoic acid synthase [Burkholderiales bacterium]|nr:class I poly(R)-hydroxyalkanoic acid synthase [Burkholderiales bacterium]
MNSPQTLMQALLDQAGRASAEQAQSIVQSLATEQRIRDTTLLDALTAALAQDSEQLNEIQQRYYRQHLELWKRVIARADQGAAAAPVIAPEKTDRRFQSPEWNELPFFDYLKQAYLLNSRWLGEMVEAAALDAPAKHRLRFFTRQWLDAVAPANFPATNPEVLKLAQQTGGESLLRGIENLNADLKKGRITMTDEAAFEVGRNLAVTPGAVVFENDLMQLIQYAPLTETVHEKPLLIVPPCINKYYILDLQPDNSFVRYAVAQGHTVFMVSWRNVPQEMGRVTWDEYLERGVIRAIDAVLEICGSGQLNALGFCIGGTLLAPALAVLRAREREPAASLTLLTAMLDFSDVGDLAVFVDENYVTKREQDFAAGGVLNGRELGLTFSSLRANELIWNYVVNNYLKGQQPEPFDLLYWNSDSTNLPGAMYVYYLRNTYLENNLRVPGRLTMCGVPIDLDTVAAPAYVLAAREDHIVPWKTAYQSTQLLGGQCEFVLTASGHIAGVVNPAAKNKRHYWLNTDLPADADAWFAAAAQRPGSWWSHWSGWLAPFGGMQVPARPPGGAKYPAIEPAPGRYVKERIQDTGFGIQSD